MTRELKISLLVGLLFVLVVGMLLSDHVTSVTRTNDATLTGAGDDARDASAVPSHLSPDSLVPPAMVQHVTDEPVRQFVYEPTQPQVTQQKTTREQVIDVNVGVGPEQPPVPFRDPFAGPTSWDQPQQPSQNAQFVIGENATVGRQAETTQTTHLQPGAPVTEAAGPTELERAINQAGEEVVRVDASGRPVEQQQPTATPVREERLSGVTEYVAQPGDSLSRMAKRLLGSDTPANRDAIAALNPKLAENRDLVVVGRTYYIPATAGSRPTTPTAAQSTKKTETKTKTGGTYTVEKNDSLWSIAQAKLGNGTRWKEIAELNKDLLGGDTQVRVGMTLKLPAQ